MYTEIISAHKEIIALFLMLGSIITGTVMQESLDVVYHDPNSPNTITFYDDGTFFIDQQNDIGGTYIETPRSYEIKYTESGFGETIVKVDESIDVHGEIWNRI